MSTPPPSGSYPPYPEPDSTQTPSAKGFFGALFDFSFEHYATPVIIRVVYIIVMVVLGLSWLAWLIFGLAQSAALFIFALVVGGLAMLVYLAFARMSLELIMAIIRMSQDIHRRLPGG